MRDEDGNLLVVYHGTDAEFTVFDRSLNYFTDSKKTADSYSEDSKGFVGYLDIKNPFFIDAVGEKWSRIPIDATTKKMLDGNDAGSFKEGGKWRSSPADIASAVKNMVDSGKADYDGVIIRNVDDTGNRAKNAAKNIANDYITFKSQQFKSVDNTDPTSLPDIRYSLKDADILSGKLTDEQALRETKKANTMLEAENRTLRRQLDYWRKQTKLTKEHTANSKDIRKMANSLIKSTSSTATTDDIAGMLQELGDYLVNNHADALDYNEMRKKAAKIARHLIENSETEIDDGAAICL